MTRKEGVTDQAQSRKLGPRKRNPIQMASDIAIKALMAKGFSVRKSADFLGISPTTAQKAMTRLREQGELTSGLVSVARDEKLGKLVDHYLDAGIKSRKVKGSDALGAAKLYADRRYPAREAAPRASMSFTAVYIHEALMDREPAGQVLDVDPDPGPDAEPPEGTP